MKKVRMKLEIRCMLMLLCLLLAGCGGSNNPDKLQNEQVKENRQTEETQTNEVTSDKVEEKEQEEQAETLNDNKEDNQEQVKIDESNEQKESEDEKKEQESQVINQEQDTNQNQGDIKAGESEDMKTKILVYKGDRRLELWQNDELANSFQIGLGKKSEGKKEKEGDLKTPEGEYYVCTRNQYSKFYLSLGVSYPNIDDAVSGLESGLIDEATYGTIESAIQKGECPPWNTALGGEIMIHGHGGSKDWTKGCIAVDDEVMDVLWEACPIGTQIIIYP